MTDTQALRDLLVKVEAGGELPRPLPFTVWQSAHILSAYRGSLDAAKALHDAVLPGWWLQHLGHNLAGWGVRIETQGISIPDSSLPSRCDCPARAWLICILRALIAQAAP